MRQYVGITGFTDRSEVLAVLDGISDLTGHVLMVGVLASLKTLREYNKKSSRSPSVLDIGDIFVDRPGVFNVVHFYSRDTETLAEQMREITIFGGEHMHGIQLNIAWPPMGALIEYRGVFPDKKIILQVGTQAFKEVGYNPSKLAARISGYAGLFDYVLLDESAGTGKPMDTKKLIPFISVINESFPGSVVVAGGLCSDTIQDALPIAQRFNYINLDAEGQIRTEDDRLDINKSIAWYNDAVMMLGAMRST